ncbi:MAG: hypothetical protein ACMXX7_00300 [Candidatus Woesearchaeota archaeon]
MNDNFWDPAGVNLESVKNPDYLANKEEFAKKYFKLILYGSLVFAILSSVYVYFRSGNLELTTFIFFSIALPILFVSYFFLGQLKKKLKLYSVAKKNDWLYIPEKNQDLFNKYVEKFPEVFDLGSNYVREYFENVFWGNYSKDNYGQDFVLGDFKYATRNRNDSRVYHDKFFIVRLKTDISAEFYLETKTISSKISNMFGNRDVLTESVDLNNAFDFFYKENNDRVKVDVLSLLSPVVLEQIVRFNNEKKRSFHTLKNTRIYFKKDCIIFVCPGSILDIKGSLSLSSLEIKVSDELEVKKDMDFFFDLATKISNSLSSSKY